MRRGRARESIVVKQDCGCAVRTVRNRDARWLLSRLALAAWVGISIGLILYEKRLGPQNDDWQLWVAVAEALERGESIYQTDTKVPWVWSPVLAPIMAGVVLLGYWPWLALHVGALLLLRSPTMIGLVLISWPFWSDVAGGNVFTFVFVAAALAVRGSRPAALAHLLLFFMMPRIVQLPIAAWSIWTMPTIRLPAAVLLIIHTAVVAASGMGAEWVGAMAAHASPAQNLGPSYFVGLWWLAIGIPAGLWFWRRGWTGTAGLMLNTYLLPQYMLLPLIDLPFWRRGPTNQPGAAKSAQTGAAAAADAPG